MMLRPHCFAAGFLTFFFLTELTCADAGPAVADALRAGRALCKVISRNDAGIPGSHQSGLYLPKAAWRLFTGTAAVEEENRCEEVTITWNGDTTTGSVISWYGKSTRSEYRLTRIGGILDGDSVGDLLVLVPQGERKFHAHVLRTEEDAASFCAALGIESGERWGIYGKEPAAADGDRYSAWAAVAAQRHDSFPSGLTMADEARKAVAELTPAVLKQSADHRLLAWMEAEYALFRAIERRVCNAQVHQEFTTVEEFIAVAATITNRRKSRAGHSLEEHVEHLLGDAQVVFEAQATIDGQVRPDILLPGKAAYNDPKHSADNLVVLGLKTTCRDRWRQVLNEGRRIAVKHLLTLQPAMSRAQLAEMHEARLQLVVPAPLHSGYELPEGCRLLTVQQFVEDMQRRFPR